MNNKGRKTTIGAIVTLILGALVFLMWFLKKIETVELAVGLSAVGVFANMIIGYFAKDQTASHTIDLKLDTGGHPDPDKEEK